MAQKIVKDSGLSIFVKEVAVPAGTHTNDFVNVGGKRGLAGFEPRTGQDGLFYVTVDTAALVRFDGVAIAFADGAPVYWTGTAITGTASTNTLIGYADRVKGAAAGPLHVQLVPGVTGA